MTAISGVYFHGLDDIVKKYNNTVQFIEQSNEANWFYIWLLCWIQGWF